MEKKAINILKMELSKNDFLYISENGICGTLIKNPFYRAEIYRTPIHRKIESIVDLWRILREEKCDIHFRDYPRSIKKITDEMENALLSEITKIEKSNKCTIIPISSERGVLITPTINNFVFFKGLRMKILENISADMNLGSLDYEKGLFLMNHAIDILPIMNEFDSRKISQSEAIAEIVRTIEISDEDEKKKKRNSMRQMKIFKNVFKIVDETVALNEKRIKERETKEINRTFPLFNNKEVATQYILDRLRFI